MSEESAGPAAGKGRIWFAIAGAIGGAILAVIVQVVSDYYAELRAEVRGENEKAAAAIVTQETRAKDLRAEFERLGDVTRRANAFVDRTPGGSAEDVRTVIRHFRVVVSEVSAGRVTREQVAKEYVGLFGNWAANLTAITSPSHPHSRLFSSRERGGISSLRDALDELAAAVPRPAQPSAIETYMTVSNAFITSDVDWPTSKSTD